ncbi:MAG: acyl-CoA dehydrogenase family protein, partial [Microthrixaceae bacterium]
GQKADAADCVEAAQDLVPLMVEHAAEADRTRTVHPEVVSALEDSGLFGVITPNDLGGMGHGIAELGAVTRVMAQGCCASAWTMSFLMLHNWFLTRFPSQTRAELFEEHPWCHTAAPLAPTGKATRTDRGWVIDGRWEWATGVNHASHVLVHALDEHTPPPEGAPFSTRFALIPVDELEVQDVWFTSGMRATGSNAVVAEGVEVPDDFTVSGHTMLYGNGSEASSPLDRLPLMATLALVASAPALGAAEAVVDQFGARMRERVLAYTLGSRQADQPAARIRLSAALAEVRAARALWEGALESLTVASESAVGATLGDRAAARLAAAQTVRMSRAAISTVAEASGASVYAESSPFQRLQRDVEVLKGHVVFDWDRSAELVGRVELGMELGPTDLI